MSEEFNAFMTNGTWDLVPSQSHYNIVGNRWIFWVKCHPASSISTYKAHLVAKGYHQHPSVDFFATFSPVIKPQTIKVVLTNAISKGWSIHQMDVNNAFVHGNLTKEVYMRQLLGFVHP